MSVPLGALTSASTVVSVLVTDESLNDTPKLDTCSWCGKKSSNRLCVRCGIIEGHALILARQIALVTEKGGTRLYIGIERTGQHNELLSVVRWSPFEPQALVEYAAWSLATSP